MSIGNESAFPIYLQDGLTHNSHVDPGLTKREYFSAMAMMGILSNEKGAQLEHGTTKVPQHIAEHSVYLADLLITELNEEK